MTCLDEDEGKWYCFKDDEVYFAKESNWRDNPPLLNPLLSSAPAKLEPTMQPLRDRSVEIMLTEQLTVLMEGTGIKRELEGEFGGGLVGALVLTNHRLIFVSTNKTKEEYGLGRFQRTWVYSQVEDIASIPNEPGNLFIQISSISSVTGHKWVIRPSLEVRWTELGQEQGRVFVQLVTTGTSGKKTLGDWATVLERLKDGTQPLLQLPGSSRS
jgi:hypothetical protein